MSLGCQYCSVHGAGSEGGTNPTDSCCLFCRRNLSQKSWFSPKGNVQMNILISVHLIHIPEAFSKAETELHTGILQSRYIAFGLVRRTLCYYPFYGIEELQGTFKAMQALQLILGHSYTNSSFRGLLILTTILYVYDLLGILHVVSHLILTIL